MPDVFDAPAPIVAVRRATTSDAKLLAALGGRLFEQSFGAANAPDDIRLYLAKMFSVEAQTEVLENGNQATWIAEDAGRAAVGYATMYRGSTTEGVIGAKPAEVARMYVDQTLHGRGVGDALMRACIEQARAWHCDVLWIGVWERNPRAIAFYEKTGFNVVGRKTFLLGRDIQRDLVMARSLG